MKIIKTKTSYVTREGVTKTRWHEIGIIYEKDGKEFMTLHSNPSVSYYIFPKEEKK